MKEIDLLPKWYKSSRRRQCSYHTQYAILGGILLIMVVWNFVIMHSVSKAKSDLAQLEAASLVGENDSLILDGIKGKLEGLKKKTDVLEDIDSRIDVAGVLAEISFLVDETVVLRSVVLNAEKFADEQSQGSSVVRTANRRQADKGGHHLGNVRFKVTLTGASSDASGVADLMCKMEDSPYFSQVILSFSRNANVKSDSPLARGFAKAQGASGTEVNYQVSEFEINCYLANYQQAKKPAFAKEVKSGNRKR
jgi:hypothetical protein